MQTKATFMAVLLVALAGALVTGTLCPAEVSVNCPEEDGPTPVYLAYPYDCSKFCICNNQEAILAHCAMAKVFDDTLKMCNYPFLVSSHL